MRTCLFCDNPANSKEHVWPNWILQRPGFGQPIRRQIGDDPDSILLDPRLTVRAVCKTCNEGWMSTLEAANIPLVGALMQDLALSLNGLQQYNIAMWALKTAIVSEFVSRKHRELFFHKSECEQIRVASNPPALTTISIARHSSWGLGLWGTDGWSEDRAVRAHVNTILVGHLAIQSVVLRTSNDGELLAAKSAPGPRPWDQLCVEIWPTRQSVTWPPPFSFNNEANDFSILRFVRRYSYGKNLLKTPRSC